jgi:hypothetical protein
LSFLTGAVPDAAVPQLPPRWCFGEADVPLTQLARAIGEQEAARRWRRVHRAATRLWDRLEQTKIAFEHRASQSLYLAGDVLDAEDLRAEAELRARHYLPSSYLSADAVAERFGIAPRAATVSTDSFAADPLRLTLAMLDAARGHGAGVTFPADVLHLRHAAERPRRSACSSCDPCHRL